MIDKLLATTILLAVAAAPAAGEEWTLSTALGEVPFAAAAPQGETVKTPVVFLAACSAASLVVSSLPAQPMVMDFSPYWGGSGREHARHLSFDAEGRVCLMGYTSSDDFPTRNGLWAVKDCPRVYFGQEGDIPLQRQRLILESSGLRAIRDVSRFYLPHVTERPELLG